jgi:hypothetical protein
MILFVKYMSDVGIYPSLQSFFGNIRKDNKGLSVWDIVVV